MSKTRLIIPIGTRYGRLVIVKELPPVEYGYGSFRMFKCLCDCGTNTDVFMSAIRSGGTKSCGCLNIEVIGDRARKHGKRKTRAYYSWRNMKTRCTNKANRSFSDYGGRGISFCDEWDIFENFYRDMGDPPKGMSLDRIDNEKGYFKDNCRWATKKVQANNKRSSVSLTHEGKTQTVSQWGQELGLQPNTIYLRLKKGWDIQTALCPVMRLRRRAKRSP